MIETFLVLLISLLTRMTLSNAASDDFIMRDIDELTRKRVNILYWKRMANTARFCISVKKKTLIMKRGASLGSLDGCIIPAARI